MLLIMQYEKEDPGMLFTTGRYNPVFNVYFWHL